MFVVENLSKTEIKTANININKPERIVIVCDAEKPPITSNTEQIAIPKNNKYLILLNSRLQIKSLNNIYKSTAGKTRKAQLATGISKLIGFIFFLLI